MTTPDNRLIISWCRDAKEIPALAEWFTQSVSPSYISHSELQGQRAINPQTWSKELPRVLEEEFRDCIQNPLEIKSGQSTRLLALARSDGQVLGLMLVYFSKEAVVPFAVLEDIVVAKQVRGKNVGKRLIEWLDEQCSARKISRQFLESGLENSGAHKLFEKIGFKTISKVMMRELNVDE